MNKLLQAILWLIFVASLVACGSTSALKEFKHHHKKGHYEKVIKIEVECKANDEACNQLHLIKGDACYRLGKEGKEPVKHFDCAIKNLEKGIKLTKKWQHGDFDLNRDQTYENLCESLRERQDLSKGEEANQLTRHLLKTSAEFAEVSPENLAAIYFNNSAKFTLLRGAILTAPGDAQVCATVNGILSDLNAVSTKAANSKYSAQFTRLTGDVEGVKPALQNCP